MAWNSFRFVAVIFVCKVYSLNVVYGMRIFPRATNEICKRGQTAQQDEYIAFTQAPTVLENNCIM
jgi:hypothetical protein